MSAHHHQALPPVESLLFPNKTKNAFLWVLSILATLGITGTAILFKKQVPFTALMSSYLVAYLFILTLGLGALFFVLLQHVTGSTWSIAIRKIPEAILSTMPLLALLFLPILFFMKDIYPWASHGHGEHSVGLMGAKAIYFNPEFFMIRAAIYWVIWCTTSFYILQQSKKLDKTGDPTAILKLRRWSAPALILFAITISFAAFDWVMSLDTSWYSTIFGVYVFAGSFFVALATIALVAVLLSQVRQVGQVITVEHQHDLGKLLLGFTVFWAYIAYSQYFLIWYSNIPEETHFFAKRWFSPGMKEISLLLILLHFVLPFFALISRSAKRNSWILGVVAFIAIIAHYVDLYWLVIPEFRQYERANLFVWSDLTTLLFTVGIFGVWVVYHLTRRVLVPIKDPQITLSVEFANA